MMGSSVDRLHAPGTRAAQSEAQQEKDRAIAVARVILRAPNIDKDSDIALLARQLLRELALSP